MRGVTYSFQVGLGSGENPVVALFLVVSIGITNLCLGYALAVLLGYFVADSVDHGAAQPVYNRIVTLRDSWAKLEEAAAT